MGEADLSSADEAWVRPEAYFDLAGWEHGAIFAGVTRVWEVLERIADYLAARLRPGVAGHVHPGAWLEGAVEIGSGAVVEAGAYIRGPALIGPGAHVRHGAYIRGDCLIGAGCVVGHASELKRAILLDGAQAPHFNYVGDAVLGRNVNLGAGVKLSNFKNDGSLIEIQAGTRRIPTGLRKFGAIVGDGSALGCNAVTSPGTLIGKNTLVYANAVLRGVYPAGSVIKLRQAQETVVRR